VTNVVLIKFLMATYLANAIQAAQTAPEYDSPRFE